MVAHASEHAEATPPPVDTSEPVSSGALAGDEVDGAALQKKHVERMKADTTPVTVLQGGSALELGRRICEAVAPKRPPSTPVLLKPNFCGYDSIKDPEKFKGDDGVHGRGTDPDFVRGVVQCLKKRGHTKITIAEGCGHSHKMFVDTAHLLGYDKMAAEEGVRLVALDDDGVFDVEGDKPGKALPISGIGASHVPTLMMPKVLAEHLDHRPVPVSPQGEGAPLRRHLDGDQGHAGHGDAQRQDACVQQQMADAQRAQRVARQAQRDQRGRPRPLRRRRS